MSAIASTVFTTRMAFTTRLKLLLLGIAIVLLPFNDLPYFQGLFGELASEGAFFCVLGILALWSLDLAAGDRVPMTSHWTFLALCGLLGWTLVSALANFPEIVDLATKGRTGPSKLFLQTLLLTFVLIATLAIFRTFLALPDPLRWFRRWALVSFLVAGAYSAFELAAYFGTPMPGPLVAFTAAIHGGDAMFYFGRIRSVSGEASWFGMYLSAIFPWLLSYFFTARRHAWVPLMLLGYLFLLVVLSWSRTAYVITAVQVFAAMGLALLGTSAARGRVVVLGAALALAGVAAYGVFEVSPVGEGGLVGVFTSLLSSDNLSNIGRAGSQSAAFAMARESPMFGVGLGEYGFHMAEHMPSWARQSDEVQLWMSRVPGTPWAPVHSVYARLAAEAGFVGVSLWLLLWMGVLIASFRVHRARLRAGTADPLGAALVVSILGMMLAGVNADSLRFFSYWLVLGLAWAYLAARRHRLAREVR